jgi:hypothetical protein
VFWASVQGTLNRKGDKIFYVFTVYLKNNTCWDLAHCTDSFARQQKSVGNRAFLMPIATKFGGGVQAHEHDTL